MTKSVVILTAVAALVFAAPAFAADTASSTTETKVQGDSNGNYDKKVTIDSTDAAGTTTKDKAELKVKEDSKGNVKKTLESKTSTDPKGLMNKTTDTTSTTVENNADGSASYHHKKKVDGKVVEEEKTETK